jgi:phosphocarrier protein
MYSKKTKIINETGLHARPASAFIAEAKKYKSQITIADLDKAKNNPSNAKSIIAILSLGIGPGTNVEISADGEDETKAVNALVKLIESGFGE